jgi:hypothetical protein
MLDLGVSRPGPGKDPGAWAEDFRALLMNDSASRLNDPAALADEVRSLASDAHRSLTGRSAVPNAAGDLSQRASLLKSRIDCLEADDLSLWLENLRQRIDSPEAPPAPAGARPMKAEHSPGGPKRP